MKPLLSALALLLLLAAPLAADDGADVEAACIAVVKAEIEAMRAEDEDKAAACHHPESQGFAQMKPGLKRLFEIFDLKYTLEKLEFLGHDDEVATLRYRLTTQKVKGEAAFVDNTVDQVVVLRKHEGKWLVFGGVVIRIR